MPKIFIPQAFPRLISRSQLPVLRSTLSLLAYNNPSPRRYLNTTLKTNTSSNINSNPNPRPISSNHKATAKMSSNPVFAPGKLAVITGGASGIGLALATKCAGYGMKVVIVDNNASNLKAAKESIKGSVETAEMDVGKVEDFEGLKVS